MRILHPRPKPGRQKALGVEFIDGVAEVESLHPERRLALIQHGYSIEETPAERDAPKRGRRVRQTADVPDIAEIEPEAVIEAVGANSVSEAWTGDEPETTED